jgi:hypothetical protein
MTFYKITKMGGFNVQMCNKQVVIPVILSNKGRGL